MPELDWAALPELSRRSARGSYAGAAGAAATSLGQDLFNGRPLDAGKAREAAGTGGALGALGGVLGRSWSNGLSNKEKEILGENASRVRTWARGGRTAEGPKTRQYLEGGRYTYPDQRTFGPGGRNELVESKFGRSAKLSARQREAFHQLSNYRVDHTLPQDIGVLFAAPAWIYGRRGVVPVTNKH